MTQYTCLPLGSQPHSTRPETWLWSTRQVVFPLEDRTIWHWKSASGQTIVRCAGCNQANQSRLSFWQRSRFCPNALIRLATDTSVQPSSDESGHDLCFLFPRGVSRDQFGAL